MKKRLIIFITLLFTLCASIVGLIACDEDDAETDIRDSQIVSVYNMYVAYAEENGENPLSYEEWIQSIKGKDGTNGIDGINGKDGVSIVKIEKTNTEGLIDTYTITYSDGNTFEFTIANGEDGKKGDKGDKGDQGENGKMPQLKINEDTNFWEVSYDDGATWTSLGVKATGNNGSDGSSGSDGEDGEDGKSAYEIWLDNGHTGTEEEFLAWLKDGKDGENGKSAYEIWLDNGHTGTQSDFLNWLKGENGKMPQLKINEDTNFWEVSYDDGATWTSLGVKATGNNGSDGSSGSDGNDGKTPLLRINPETNIWEVSYDDGATWTSLGVKATGNNGSDGSSGSDGEDGEDGKSAYEIWLDNGHTGTEEEFLAWLKDGKDGENGKSAYEIWLDNGHTGTQSDFLNWLKGENGVGIDGITPQLRINEDTDFWEVSYDNGANWTSLGVKATGNNGSDGSSGSDGNDGKTPLLRINSETNIWEVSYDDGATWTSLGVKATGNNGSDGNNGADGEDGEDGKSAYEIWLDNGHTGTEEEFLAWLKGEDGENGKSAYEIWLDNGHTGTQSDFLNWLKGENGVGIDGITPQLRINEDTDFWEVSYDNGATWTSLNIKATGEKGGDGENGQDGTTPQLRINETTNEWEVSYDKGATWTSLGVKATGNNGSDGSSGSDGNDGKTPLLRINSETNIWEVSYDDGATWTSLEVKATGNDGSDGSSGSDGNDGKTPLLRINSETNIWEVSYDNGATYTSLEVKATGNDGSDGEDGKSAYEIWLDNGHTGTEEEFLAWLKGEDDNPQGLDFYPLPDGIYAVGVGKAKFLNEIVIPAEYNGKKVTKIAKNAFRDCESITNITIPDSVTIIGGYAFANCTSLTNITIPDSVTSIGDEAFDDCTALNKVYYKGTEAEWNSITIGSLGNDYLTNATRYYYSEEYPENFVANTYWHYVAGVPTVWEEYFSEGLTYALNSDNNSYSVTGIGTCTDTDIVIPSTYEEKPVTAIGNSAFYSCSLLTSVIIPASVTSIELSAFYNCTALETVYYKGTAAGWRNITIGNDNNNLTNATRYYYSEIEPTGEGNYWHYVDDVPTIWDSKWTPYY